MAGKGLTETPLCVYHAQTPTPGGKISTFFFCQGIEVLDPAAGCYGKEKSGLGCCVAKDGLEVKATSTVCQGHFISGKWSSSFLNDTWRCLSYY